MKLISWNVNGIRAVHKRGQILTFIEKEKPDILFFQEVKAKEEQLPEEIVRVAGYHSYFVCPTEKKGYSGVALYTKEKPIKVSFGMGIPELDQEGRLIIAEYETFICIGGYFPNGGGGPVRLAYKLDFYDAFLAYIKKERMRKPIIFTGDVNTAHEEIDLARPKENEENTGFLPEERAWIDEVVASGFVDIYRFFHPTTPHVYTYWDMKTRARERNVGWRIDYFFVDTPLVQKVKKADILANVPGSDHCPITLEWNP